MDILSALPWLVIEDFEGILGLLTETLHHGDHLWDTLGVIAGHGTGPQVGLEGIHTSTFPS